MLLPTPQFYTMPDYRVIKSDKEMPTSVSVMMKKQSICRSSRHFSQRRPTPSVVTVKMGNRNGLLGLIAMLLILDNAAANWWQFHNIYTIGALEGPTSSAVTTITAAVTGSIPTTDQTAASALPPTGSTNAPAREHHNRNHQFSHMTQHQICHKFLNLTDEQRRMCMSNEKFMEVIANGARLGREECQHQFRHSRWNCTAPPNSTTLYGAVTSIRSRETAFVHAINSAALAWTVTRACSKADLTECNCDNTKRKKQRKWQWGGCSEDINYGVQFSRKFIDNSENSRAEVGLMNLHNNEAGRRALRSRMQRICKCHGMSGSCSMKVCWRRLPNMRVVTEALGLIYDGASLARMMRKDGKPPKLRPKEMDQKKLMKTDLIYLTESPDYCERNDELGILGTRGRICNRTSHGLDGCRLLCCGRGYQTRVRHVEEKCNCRFVWCCNVKCEMCNYKREEHVCN